MFSKILIANRGEIACRIISSATRLGIRTVAVFSEADRESLHVRMADEAICIGPAPAADSYLNGEKILEAARSSGAEAIHPGYGFLSENPDFAAEVERAGIVFVGPSHESIRAMGLKDSAKEIMAKEGVPVLPGFSCGDCDAQSLAEQAEEIGFPVLVKAVAGGGGKGMRLATSIENFTESLDSARREAISAFGNGDLMVEKFVDRPRHIEVQVFGDRYGDAVHIFERDCSLQRRNQKLIEEAPAPGMTENMRRDIGEAAVAAARSIGYENAGTVEFIAESREGLRSDRFWFLEMNTRLQVEHPVTEMISGLDLVEWQFRIAAGEKIPDEMRNASISGHSIEARVYAEDSEKGFVPAFGRLSRLALPANTRVDCGYSEGEDISRHYDGLIAKVVVHGRTRTDAVAKLAAALDASEIGGLPTNLSVLSRLVRNQKFRGGLHDTGLVEREFADGGLISPPSCEAIALAAAAAASGGCEMRSMSNFSLWIPLSTSVTLSCGDQLFTADVEKGRGGMFKVGYGGQEFTIRLDGGSVWINERKSFSRLSVRGDEICMVLGGHWTFRSIGGKIAKSSNEKVSGNMLAPMPGLVKQVMVKPGEAVEAGQILFFLEAMKMEHSVVADGPGRVAELLVEAGRQVEAGQLLAVLEPDRASPK